MLFQAAVLPFIFLKMPSGVGGAFEVEMPLGHLWGVAETHLGDISRSTGPPLEGRYGGGKEGVWHEAQGHSRPWGGSQPRVRRTEVFGDLEAFQGGW